MVVKFTVSRFTVLLVIGPTRTPPADPPPILSGPPPEQLLRSDAKPVRRQMLMPWAEDYIP